jgi:hypothetical protein
MAPAASGAIGGGGNAGRGDAPAAAARDLNRRGGRGEGAPRAVEGDREAAARFRWRHHGGPVSRRLQAALPGEAGDRPFARGVGVQGPRGQSHRSLAPAKCAELVPPTEGRSPLAVR